MAARGNGGGRNGGKKGKGLVKEHVWMTHKHGQQWIPVHSLILAMAGLFPDRLYIFIQSIYMYILMLFNSNIWFEDRLW